MKTCTKCSQPKPPSEFYSRQSACKACVIARVAARYVPRPKRPLIDRDKKKTCPQCGEDFTWASKPGVSSGSWRAMVYCSKSCSMRAKYGEASARFDEHVMPEPMSGCWLWIGPISRRGYGDFRVFKKHWRAHRFAYLLHKGDFDRNLVVLHKCDTPICVNPDHLTLGTQKDNLADMAAKGRGFWQQ